MKKNQISGEKSKKTIRMNKVQFFFMMLVTPIFAAYTAVFSLIAIESWLTKDDKVTIEVPVLGGVEEETPGEKSAKEAKPAETKVVETKTEEKKTESKPSETKTTTKKTTTTVKKTETKKTEPKKVEKSAKELCEERADGPTTRITVHFLNKIEIQDALEFTDKEDPIVSYTKEVVKNGQKAKMVYKNNTCVPSTDNLETTEDIYLEKRDLGDYDILRVTDYQIWK